MINMYGKGESHLQKCPTCDYEEELKSGGVHVTENGAVIVYANDDQFSCPNCSSENDKQQPENISGMSYRCNAPFYPIFCFFFPG